MSTKPLTVVIPPEVLEQMERDIPPDELQKIMDDITRMAADGSLFEQSTELDLDKLQLEDPEMYNQLMEQLNSLPDYSDDEQDSPSVNRVLH